MNTQDGWTPLPWRNLGGLLGGGGIQPGIEDMKKAWLTLQPPPSGALQLASAPSEGSIYVLEAGK